MEAVVLDCLSFRVNTPTAYTFLSMYKQALGVAPRTCALACYLAELAMLEYELLRFRPSHLAAAATCLAQLYATDMDGLSHLPYVTNYSIDDLKPCMHRMLALQHEAYNTTNVNSVFLPVKEKYSGDNWLAVAKTMPYTRLPTLVLRPSNHAPKHS
jgi:cyclin B